MVLKTEIKGFRLKTIKLILGTAWELFGLKRGWTRTAGAGTSFPWKKKKKIFRRKQNNIPWYKGKATCLGGLLHKTDITGKSKATNTAIKGQHINKVQAARDKSNGLIKKPQ